MPKTRSMARDERPHIQFKIVATKEITDEVTIRNDALDISARDSNAAIDCLSNQHLLSALRRIFIKFLFGCCIYLLSWSSILCRVVRGMVKYPDKMPMAVWVITLGILLLYETFIICQCTSIFVRIRHIANRILETNSRSNCSEKEAFKQLPPWSLERVGIRFFSAANLDDPFGISLVGACIALDLIGVILYSVPSIRDLLGISEKTQPSESFSVVVLLLLIWTLFILVRKKVHWLSKQSQLIQFLIYNTGTLLLVVVWGAVVLGAFDHKAVNEDSRFIWLGLIVSFLSLLGYFVSVNSRIDNWSPKAWSIDDNATEKGDDAIHHLAQSHKYAQIFHLALIVSTLFLFFLKSNSKDLMWWTDYIWMKVPTYFFTLDYKKMDDTTNLQTKTIDYCASRNDMPIFAVALSLAWSTLSCLQHHISRGTLNTAIANATTKGTNKCDYQREVQLIGLITAVFITVASVAAGHRNGWSCIGGIVFTLFLFCVCIPFVLLFTLGVLRLYPECSNNNLIYVLERVSRYKWVEYTFSATLMHVVVLHYAGIYSSHEVVLSAGLLAIAMCSVHTVELEFASLLPRYPDAVDVPTRAALELPFIHLSFWSKGVLTLALTVPLLFYDNRDWQVAVVWCT